MIDLQELQAHCFTPTFQKHGGFMLAKGIVINWFNCKEYLPISVEQISVSANIEGSFEIWDDSPKVYRYRVASEIRRIHKGYEVVLTCDKKENQHIDPNEVCWGRSILTILDGADAGEARWEDADDPSNNGVVEWNAITSGLRSEKATETFRRNKRMRYFRAALLCIDRRCSLTGETLEAALEAAHIIPSAQGGNEVVENGVLMRADLHRLYDSGLFNVAGDGTITGLSDDLTVYYRRILENAKMDSLALTRVQAALHEAKLFR